MGNIPEFLKELTILSQKYNVIIGGCGCCGSPYVLEYNDINNTDEEFLTEKCNLDYNDEKQCYVVTD